MSQQPPIYDLVLLLDTSAEDATRDKIVADATAAIQGDGEIVGTHAWGIRPLAYEIDKKTDAVYHLIQFHAHSRDLLAHLQRTLGIADGVLRFRIVKLEPGTPAPPDLSKPTPAFGESAEPALER
jgi:small subunit ribosomal protein S6